MEPDGVTRDDLDKRLADLQQDFEARLEKVQDRVLTAVFGFVNGASARMERLESEEVSTRNEMARLEQRLQTCERARRKPTKKAR